MARIRMCDADRETYGGPEWLGFNLATLTDDTDLGELEAIEAATDTVLAVAVAEPAGVRAIRLWLWIGLRNAGVNVEWAKFRPKVLRVAWEAGDALPPDGGPPSTDPSPSS
ncbi:hypothetical protein GCM10010124_26220 [Pilimelia terevasa]|uniref:Uncharacterized protein n=1 Tax=Pilimelia terevasa TaxID=53372 RepID=A0A8J3BQV6_9ACTN|nr:hypothetical protein [Pilimelia terevasa]GGK32178.1 hypothetical protein GCM10010124_26220 [Pilimelia terevasa]